MAIDIERVLLNQAAMDAERYPSEEAAIYGGAGLGAIAGATGIGNLLHNSGRAYETFADRVSPRYKEVKGEKVKVPRKSPLLKPGGRAAGAAITAILTAALAKKLHDEMVPESRAGEIVAKMQTGNMTEGDAMVLQQLLEDAYNQGVA